MAVVYILFSKKQDKFYIGSCQDLADRMKSHLNQDFRGSFTSKVDDWGLFLKIEDLNYGQARKIERHIKKMKSKKYIMDMNKYPEIISKLKAKYH